MAYFPMFINLERQKCLIVGGGALAEHKVKVLLDFKAEITVVSPELKQVYLQECVKNKSILYVKRCYQEADVEGMTLVVAAANQKELNHQVALDCRMRNIPVNAVDQIEDCDFIFPSYVKEKSVVAACSSSGKSPVVTQYLKKKIQPILTPQLGDIAEVLGDIRDEIKAKVKHPEKRKQLYQQLLRDALENGGRLEEEQIERIRKQQEQ